MNKLAEPERLHPRGQRPSGRDDEQRRGQALVRRAPQRPRRSRLDARGPGLCDARRADVTPGGVDAGHLHRDRPEDGRAQCRGRSLLRSVIDREDETRRGLQGAGAGANLRHRAEKASRVWTTDGTPRSRLARRVLPGDVRRKRRADLLRPAYAARRGDGKFLRRQPGVQQAHRRSARAGRARLESRRADARREGRANG